MRAFAVLIAALALVGSGSMAAVAGTPTAVLPAAVTPSAAHQGLPSAAKAKKSNITFGAGPANATKPDGRSIFTYDTSPGGQIRDHIAVLNITHHAEVLRVYTVDVAPGGDGGFFYEPRNAPRVGAGAWVAVGTPNASGVLRAKPRSTTILPVHLTVPANASPGDHVAAVIVSLTALVKGKSGQRVDLEQRVATRVLVRVSGTLRPQLSIENLKAKYHARINPFASGSVTVHYTVRNTGNAILGGTQQVSIHGFFGTTTQALKLPAIPVLLPGGTYNVTTTVPGVFPEIWMSAKVRVTPAGLTGDVNPGLKVATASTHFWAIPWILIALILLLLAFVSWTVRRRWRRSHPAKTPVTTQSKESKEGVST